MRSYLVKLLGAREHSRQELIVKVKKKGMICDDIDEILDVLQQQGSQSDKRFATEFLVSKAGAGFGPVRIRRDLLNRGVARHLVDLAFQESEVNWLCNAKKIFKKKYPGHSGELKELARRVRFLSYRGFEQDHIKTVVGEWNS